MEQLDLRIQSYHLDADVDGVELDLLVLNFDLQVELVERFGH